MLHPIHTLFFYWGGNTSHDKKLPKLKRKYHNHDHGAPGPKKVRRGGGKVTVRKQEKRGTIKQFNLQEKPTPGRPPKTKEDPSCVTKKKKSENRSQTKNHPKGPTNMNRIIPTVAVNSRLTGETARREVDKHGRADKTPSQKLGQTRDERQKKRPPDRGRTLCNVIPSLHFKHT